MSTLLLKGAEVLVTMDGARREIPGGGLYARDGVIEAVIAPDHRCAVGLQWHPEYLDAAPFQMLAHFSKR